MDATVTTDLNQTIADIVREQMASIATEIGLPLAGDPDAASGDSLEIAKCVHGAVRSCIGPACTDAILDANHVPRVTAHVELETYDTMSDMCIEVDGFDFDCTAALEAVARDLHGDELDAFCGFDPGDGSLADDLDPEDCDAIFRVAADLGLVPEWDRSFYCYVSDGLAAWSRNRIAREGR